MLDFFHSQETLSSFEWMVRAVIAFFFLLIVAKIMGQRAISQLRLLDFVIALVLGNIIAHPLSDERLGMKGSMITTVVLVILYTGGLILTLKSNRIEKFLDPAPFTLIKNGEINYKGLKKARISIDHLLAELRKEKVEDVKKVALALWESDGKISIFLDPKYTALTPANYQMTVEPFDLPKTVIREGKLDYSALKELNVMEDWLVHTLRSLHQVEVRNILLATIDSQKKIQVFLFNMK
ncbi:YetF domain-containing protein [Neobacillus drentensis]